MVSLFYFYLIIIKLIITHIQHTHTHITVKFAVNLLKLDSFFIELKCELLVKQSNYSIDSLMCYRHCSHFPNHIGKQTNKRNLYIQKKQKLQTKN